MPLREVLEQLFSGWPSRRRCAAGRPWACGGSCRGRVPRSGQLPSRGRFGYRGYRAGGCGGDGGVVAAV